MNTVVSPVRVFLPVGKAFLPVRKAAQFENLVHYEKEVCGIGE